MTREIIQLNQNEIQKNLSEIWKDLEIYLYDQVSSTNDLAKEYITTNKNETALFVAKKQTKGRGRQGRSFYSSLEDGLYFSLAIHPHQLKPNEISIYTILAATAILQAVKESFDIELQVKWVNDLFYRGKKVAGILCESVVDSKNIDHSAIIIGIGINLAGEFEDADSETKEIAGTLFESSPKGLNINAFINEFLTIFAAYQKQLPKRDFLEIYRERLLGLGEEVTYIQNKQKKKGKIYGINTDGNLLICLPNGDLETLYGQDIHFSSQQFSSLY